MEYISFILLGLFSGAIAGLLGLGGGIITVPAMALIALPLLGFPSGQIMHVAVASSLAAIIPTAFMSAYGHHRQQGIIWPIAIKLTPGLIIGSVIGALLASEFSYDGLRIAFALFLALVAIYMLISPSKLIKPTSGKPNVNSLISLPIACIAAIMGVGGGTMTVPYLFWRGIELSRSIAISAYCGLPIAVAATITFYFLEFPSISGQYVYIPAAVGISLGSIVSAPFAARFTHRLPVLHLKRLFSLILFLTSSKLLMLW